MIMTKWTEDTTIKFVEEYLAHECLWNIQSQNYRNKQAKEKGLSELAASMGIANFGAKEAENKIKNIRSTFSQELKKIKDSDKSGAGTDDIYKPTLKWFELLYQALMSKNICGPRKTQSNKENVEQNNLGTSSQTSDDTATTGQTTSDEEFSQSTSNSTQHFALPSPNAAATRKRRIKELHTLVDKVNRINTSISTSHDEESSANEFHQFGKSIAGQLKAMPLMLALQAQKYMQNYLSDLRIQELLERSSSSKKSDGSDRQNSDSSPWMIEYFQDESSSRSLAPNIEPDVNITMYSQTGESQSIIVSDDILAQAISSIK